MAGKITITNKYNSADDYVHPVVFGLILSIPVVLLLLNVWFLYYVIYKLERRGCTCAIGWRRTFIEVYLVLFFIAIALTASLPTEYAMWVSFGMSILALVYVVVTRQFIDQMNQTFCTCAKTDAFTWLNVVNGIMISVIVGH